MRRSEGSRRLVPARRGGERGPGENLTPTRIRERRATFEGGALTGEGAAISRGRIRARTVRCAAVRLARVPSPVVEHVQQRLVSRRQHERLVVAVLPHLDVLRDAVLGHDVLRGGREGRRGASGPHCEKGERDACWASHY